jgi:hypothetical protein
MISILPRNFFTCLSYISCLTFFVISESLSIDFINSTLMIPSSSLKRYHGIDTLRMYERYYDMPKISDLAKD